MESPVFIAMVVFYLLKGLNSGLTVFIITLIFLTHYFQRSFIFPFLIKGKSRMPIAIILMGVVFNLVNAYMIGCWLYIYSFPPYTVAPFYTVKWLYSPQFIIGTVI